jgi:hypothetical protein
MASVLGVGVAKPYFLLAALCLGLFFAGCVFFGEQMSAEEKQMVDAADSLNKSRAALMSASASDDYGLILPAVLEYNRSVADSFAAFTSACASSRVRERQTEICSDLELIGRCNKRDAEVAYLMTKLAYVPETMSKSECSGLVASMRQQNECGVLDASYVIDDGTIAQVEDACGYL